MVKDKILAANSYATLKGENAFERKILRDAFKAGVAFGNENSPINPITCELIRGDIVRLKVDPIDTHNLFIYAGMGLDSSYPNTITIFNAYAGTNYKVKRDELILVECAGVKIER